MAGIILDGRYHSRCWNIVNKTKLQKTSGLHVASIPLIMEPLTRWEGANVCVSEVLSYWVYISSPSIFFK